MTSRVRHDLAHPDAGGTGLGEPSQLQVGKDGRHQVAELVSDPTGEDAETLAPLGLEDLGLELQVGLLRPHTA